MAYKPNRPKKKRVKDGYVPPYDAELMQKPIEYLGLTEEVLEKLKAAGITTIFAVVMLTERALLHVNRFNKKNLAVLVSALKSKNLDIRPMPQLEEGEGTHPSKANTGEKKGLAQNEREKSKRTTKSSGLRESREEAPSKERQDSKPDANKREKKEKSARDKESFSNIDKHSETARDEYVKVNKNGLWGFEDRKGKVVVPSFYDEVFNYKEDLCCVMKEKKYGFINRAGEVVIPVEYDLALSFSEGFACVFKGDKCGYIDLENKEAVPFLYDAGTPVINGECRVKKLGRWGELHLASPSEVRWII